MNTPYNPLDKLNLARSIESQLLREPAIRLDSLGNFSGAGVYAIYYAGNFPGYSEISQDPNGDHPIPIYVGKAIPKGGRKGGLSHDSAKGTALRDRLRQHANSILEAGNIEIEDFWVRYLVVDDIWIPLGENALIEQFRPAWNLAIDGFGNKDPGNRRATQYRSQWDILHPGRDFAVKLADSGIAPTEVLERLALFFSGQTMTPIPVKLRAQVLSDRRDAQNAADDA